MSFSDKDLRLLQDAITYYREHAVALSDVEHRLDILWFKLQFSIDGI